MVVGVSPGAYGRGSVRRDRPLARSVERPRAQRRTLGQGVVRHGGTAGRRGGARLERRIPTKCRCPLSPSCRVPLQWRKAGSPGSRKKRQLSSRDEFLHKSHRTDAAPLERIEVKSPDGILPGYLIKATTKDPAPVVVFYSGFDVVKEMLYCFVREEFAQRGISCLVMDTPGVGEPLRLHNVPSRPGYEVHTRSVIDYLETRSGIGSSRIGILGISLGGYYAPRSAAFEPRIKACVAWGGIWDYGAVWRKRWAARPVAPVGRREFPEAAYENC